MEQEEYEIADQTDELDELSQAAYQARESGDAAEAQRLFDARDQLAAALYDGATLPEGEKSWDDLEIELPDQATVESITELMEAQEGGAELLREWGSDFEDNIGYTKMAFEWVSAQYPDGLEFLDNLPPTPGLLELGARLGRMLASYEPLDMPIIPNRKEPQMANQKPAGKDPVGTVDQQIDSLTLKAHEAQLAGNRLLAAELFNQRDALAERFYSEPLVGHSQRTL